MKKIVLLVAGLATACAASADWGTSMESPVKVFPTGTRSYATEVKAAPDGSVWALIYHPNLKDADSEFDTKHVVYEYRLQHFDPQGNPSFPEEGVLLSDYSNWSYTTVNDYLLVDSDGNAVIAVNDCRNSNDDKKSYTAYKVSPSGEHLWSEDGVAVSDPLNPAELVACMNLVELEDHSYVFAWSEISGEDSNVHLQRIDKDGNALWGTSKTFMPEEITGYPYLVNAGDNTFIMAYGRTASSIIYACKLDFECESVWGKDVRIYRGGWGQIPLHTLLDVKSSGDGGVLVSWTDDRAATNVESAYLSYVTADGKLGFSGASDEADVKLCYDGWRCFNLAAVPAADGSCFYAVWRRTNGSQTLQGIMMQKISKQGELLWGDDAIELEPYKQTSSYGYVSLQQAGEDGACAFYDEYRGYYDQQCLAARFDRDGQFVWENGSVALSVENRQSASLLSQPFGTPGAWLVSWTDGGSDNENDRENTYMMTCLKEDGTFGTPSSGLESVVGDAAGEISYADGSLHADVADGTVARVFDSTGACVTESVFSAGTAQAELPAGLYIASVPGAGSLKFIIK